MRDFINIVTGYNILAENMITGLRPRYDDLDLGEAELTNFAKNAGSAEAFANKLAEPDSPAYPKLVAFYVKAEATGFTETRTKFVIPYVGQQVAEKLGATGYKGLNGLLPWNDQHSNAMGGKGYVITTPEGRVFTDATVEDNTIYMAQISVENRASGLGTKFMEALHQVAIDHGWQIVVYKVTNAPFFRRFPWLEEDRHGNFKSAFNV